MMRFFSNGRGNGSSPVNYLIARKVLARDENRNVIRDDDGRAIMYKRVPLPEVLAGSAERTRDLIDAVPYQWRYTSGVIAFESDDRPTDEEQQIVRSQFETLAFAGLASERRDIFWVRHTHENRVELHFLVPRIELESGRSFNIAPPGSSHAYDALRDVLNKAYGWADPLDPARNRETRSLIESLQRGNVREKLHDWILDRIAAGEIKDRMQMIECLQNEGFQVSRLGKDYITTLEPVSGEKFRLRGEIFHENWTQSATLERAANEQCRAGRDKAFRCGERLEKSDFGELEARLQTHIQRRSEYNRERYGSVRSVQQDHDRGCNASDRTGVESDQTPFPTTGNDGLDLRCGVDRHDIVRELLVQSVNNAGDCAGQSDRLWTSTNSNRQWLLTNLGREPSDSRIMSDRQASSTLSDSYQQETAINELKPSNRQNTDQADRGADNDQRAEVEHNGDVNRLRARIIELRRAVDQNIRRVEQAVRDATYTVKRSLHDTASCAQRWHEIAHIVGTFTDRLHRTMHNHIEQWKERTAEITGSERITERSYTGDRSRAATVRDIEQSAEIDGSTGQSQKSTDHNYDRSIKLSRQQARGLGLSR